MVTQYLIVCDRQGSFLDGRCIGTDQEISIQDVALIIQAAIWQGWAIRLTTEEPVINSKDGPIVTWLKHTEQASPKLLVAWRDLNNENDALKKQNADLLNKISLLEASKPTEQPGGNLA